MKLPVIINIGIVFLLLLKNVFYGQGDLLNSLSEEERSAVEAIALYPKEERSAVLEVSKYPETLVRMQNIRKKSEEEFKKILTPMDEEDQKEMFDITRYPDLMAEIGSGNKKKNNKEMEKILSKYPEEIHNTAKHVNKTHFDDLTSINQLHQASDQKFDFMLKDYPSETQKAYDVLLGLPEVLTILTDNISTTILLGDIYKHHPQQLEEELDSLNVVLAEQKAREFNEWKESMENDPEAKAEYEKASKEFARDQGYDETSYQQPVTNVYVNYVWRPYPYWFGWPWWYGYECWYPYPAWYHWGYYYGPNNVIVYIGYPSNYFMYWHFNHYAHFYHYPHFTNHVIQHHYAHPTSHNSITRSVQHWEKDTKPNLPKNWMNDDRARVERIKEYGKFKMDHEVAQSTGNRPTEKEYLKKNADSYPTLKPKLNERDQVVTPQRNKSVFENKGYSPTQKTYTPKVTPRTNNSNYNKVDKARNYHQNTWEKPKTQPAVRPKTQIKTVPQNKQIPKSVKTVPQRSKVKPR